MQPSWQNDPCPRWCAGDHLESDLPEDRVHRAPGVAVPVVSRRTDTDLVRTAHPEEYEIGLSRADGSTETWVYIGAGPGEYLEVSVESARRLIAALQHVCGREE